MYIEIIKRQKGFISMRCKTHSWLNLMDQPNLQVVQTSVTLALTDFSDLHQLKVQPLEELHLPQKSSYKNLWSAMPSWSSIQRKERETCTQRDCFIPPPPFFPRKNSTFISVISSLSVEMMFHYSRFGTSSQSIIVQNDLSSSSVSIKFSGATSESGLLCRTWLHQIVLSIFNQGEQRVSWVSSLPSSL